MDTPEEKSLEEDLSDFSYEERAILAQMLQEKQGVTPPKVLPAITSLEYERQPVDLKTWLDDPYYLGEVGRTLYPKLKEDFVSLFSGSFNECYLSGSIGWGKTHFATLGIVRIIYELSCMRSPQRAFDLAQETTIAFATICVNLKLAKKVVFEQIAQKVAQSPYFKEHFWPKMTNTEIRFPKNIWVTPTSSSDTSVLGLAVYGGIMDESNFIGEATPQQKAQLRRWGSLDKAELLYAAIMRRMKSRYMQKGGKVPGMLFVVSSKRTVEDFVERRIMEARRTSDPNVFIREYAKWEVRPEHYTHQKKFHIVIGSDQVRSRILDEGENVEEFRQMSGIQVVEVPEDYRLQFIQDFESAVRDVAGVATVAISPFITRQDKIEEAVDRTIPHPFSVFEWEAGSVASFRWNLLVRKGSNGETEPICCPRSVRHAHIDGSLRQDKTGIGVGHIHAWKEMARKDRDGNEFTEQAPVIKMDFFLRVIPPVGDEIIMRDVRDLIYEMTKHGLRVVRVTMDGFQSADSLQQLRQQGYDAEVSSVDRSIVPYELVKAAIYEDRLMLYNYQPVVDELKRLEHNKKKGKVDHPSNGEKDLADALAGVVFSLSVSRQMALSGLPPNVLAPSLGISEDPEDDVHGVMVDGKFHAVENWDEDFKGDGGIMVAPLWMTSGRGNVPTLPVQKGSREIK